jgi:hypothetical protein
VAAGPKTEVNPIYLPVAFRALVTRPNRKQRRRFSHLLRRASRWPEHALIFDAETTTDPTQSLLFGSYRYCRRRKNRYECVEEGLFYADELPERDPAGFALLQAYANERRPNVAAGFDARLRLISRREFVDRVFWPSAYISRALVVGFNFAVRLGASGGGLWRRAGEFPRRLLAPHLGILGPKDTLLPSAPLPPAYPDQTHR